MSLDAALALADFGFHVFPLIEGGKTPCWEGWQAKATRDHEQLKKWWTCPVMGMEKPYNVGISTSTYFDSWHLIAIDIDIKDGKKGDVSFQQLINEGRVFPPTTWQRTPSGGVHLIYWSTVSVAGSGGKLGSGLDVRAAGGILVGAGSSTSKGVYSITFTPMAQAPDWLVEWAGRAKGKAPAVLDLLPVDEEAANARGIYYLENEAPTSVEGDHGDDTAYKVACRLKDLGCSQASAFNLMCEHWNEECSPPWAPDELEAKVTNAYAYSKGTAGNANPQLDFEPIAQTAAPPATAPKTGNYLAYFNDRYAWVLVGGAGRIMRQYLDHKGEPKVDFLTEDAFHKTYLSYTVEYGGKQHAASREWMKHKERRSFSRMYFAPGLEVPGQYNLWRGWSVAPYEAHETPPRAAQEALDAWLEHCYENISTKDPIADQWVRSWFAQLIQQPASKPLTCLVLKSSEEGTGKTSFMNSVGSLFRYNYQVVAKQRFLTGNFNAHLEHLLLIVFDEAFWSGDKSAHGVLNDLITGTDHFIERKGLEPYRADSYLRCAVLGNADWVAPAGATARRYTVLDVGNGRRQDVDFFEKMRRGMEAGGYRALLRYLLQLDISGFNVNVYHKTKALLEQKDASMSPVHQWWLSCLSEGAIYGLSDFGDGTWPTHVGKDALRDAYTRHAKAREITARGLTPEDFSRLLIRACPSLITTRKRLAGESKQVRVYQLPPLEQCRKEFEAWQMQPRTWETPL